MQTLFAAMVLSLLPGVLLASNECHRLRFAGQVENGSVFRQQLGMGLSFRMVPSAGSSGWNFEVGQTGAKEEGVDYVYWLTPPWRSRLTTALDTSYGELAQNVAQPRTIDFWFVANNADAAEAGFAASNLIFSSPSIPEAEAWSRLGAVRMGKGTLEILRADAKAGTGIAAPDVDDSVLYGEILKLDFRVTLVVPKGFKPNARLKSERVSCPPAGEWLQRWQPS